MWSIKSLIDMVKYNPAQPLISDDQGGDVDSSIAVYTVSKAYETIEVVQRGTNLIADSAAAIRFDMQKKVSEGFSTNAIPKKKVEKLINRVPNPYQNIDTFFRNIIIDMIIEGNAFIYFDGANLYQLPSSKIKIVTDKKTFIKKYVYDEQVDYFPNEIIHIKENSSKSIYRGDSRIKSALNSINVLGSMLDFQKTFFENNAVPGLVLTTPNILSPKIKERLILSWIQKYNPKRGGKRPMILDGDFKMENLGNTDFRELDFAASIKVHEDKILKALGVPPILLDTGNNANVAPNLKLFYITTVIPIVNKICYALEFYFGYDLKPDISEVLALRPELKDQADFYTKFTNAGIITRNEARAGIRMPRSDDPIADTLYLPANIAGSAVDSSVGGRPSGTGN